MFMFKTIKRMHVTDSFCYGFFMILCDSFVFDMMKRNDRESAVLDDQNWKETTIYSNKSSCSTSISL
jgi:hypothetical protein